MAGRITHAGFVSFIENPVPAEDAHVIRLLKQAGAVIHVRTNQPQSLMVCTFSDPSICLFLSISKLSQLILV